MTIEELQKRIDNFKILAKSGDMEEAHIAEDCIWQDVLEAISNGVDNAKELAKLALSTDDIEYGKYYS